ncbi:MAG: hypothetical protein KJ042_03015 [Deltaproteobacteria bacterium]|nr:hypothetical protein [Deltaproteobacteria bacterium]
MKKCLVVLLTAVMLAAPVAMSGCGSKAEDEKSQTDGAKKATSQPKKEKKSIGGGGGAGKGDKKGPKKKIGG